LNLSFTCRLSSIVHTKPYKGRP